jgi:hypothetical protein
MVRVVLNTMRCVCLLVAFVLLGAVPALAQESASTAPAAKKPAAKHVVAKTAAKPKAAHSPAGKLGMVSPAKATAAAKAVAKKPEPVKAAAPKSDAAKPAPLADVFVGIPAQERLAIQSALLWSGDYTGAVAGEDPMLTAIKNFQKRNKAKVTGVLTPEERARLVAAAHDHEQEFGWNVVVDPATGVRIGLPTKMVPQARDAANGTRWSSAHGEVQVETFRIKNFDGNLSALFDREKKEPGTRQIEYSVLRPDNFFISGMQGLKKFSVKAQMRDGEVRGFTMLYDQAMEGIVAPVMVAMSSAFSPFPERSAPFAALAKTVEYGTGLVVSDKGYIVTDRKLAEGCQVIVAAGLGNADRVADDKDNGLALLRVYGAAKLTPLPLSVGAPQAATKPGGDVTLVGIPDPNEQDGHKTLTEVKARLVDGTGLELRQPVPMAGFSGAAALDGQGRFLGMMETRSFVLASAGPATPPVRLIGAETIRGFLAAHNVPTAAAPGGDAKSAAVRVICVRK